MYYKSLVYAVGENSLAKLHSKDTTVPLIVMGSFLKQCARLTQKETFKHAKIVLFDPMSLLVNFPNFQISGCSHQYLLLDFFMIFKGFSSLIVFQLFNRLFGKS